MKRLIIHGGVILVFLVGLKADIGYAQGPPIHTDTPITLGLEGRGIRTFSRVTRKARLLQDGREISDPMNREATSAVFPLAIPYNLMRDNVVGVLLPFVAKRLKSSAGTVSAAGMGDLAVFMKHVVFQRDRRQTTFRTALKGALTLPTGDDNTIPALGNGAVDYSLGQVSAWIKDRTGIYLETTYSFKGEANQIDRGNQLTFNTALAYRLLPGIYRTYPARQLNAYLELNGASVGRSGSRAQPVYQNSGGTTLFLSPGVQYIPYRWLLIEASVQYPIVEELHGVQLGVSFIADFGIRVLLY